MGKGNIHIFKKRRLLRFCLWLLKTSQTLIARQKQKATVDVYGVCYIPLYTFVSDNLVCVVVIHIGVGYLGVARTGELGNAKALSSGTSDRYRFPRFFFLCLLILIYFEPSGSGNLLDLFCSLWNWNFILMNLVPNIL